MESGTEPAHGHGGRHDSTRRAERSVAGRSGLTTEKRRTRVGITAGTRFGPYGFDRSDSGRPTVRRGAERDVGALAALLDKHPEKLHVALEAVRVVVVAPGGHSGHLAAVDLLLRRGLDVNTREKGDNTYAMHWAAAAGHLDVVRRLADAGGDVVGHGDDHRAGGDRLGDVLGRMRRRRASCRR